MFSISFVQYFLDGDVGSVFEWCFSRRRLFGAADGFSMTAEVQMLGDLDQKIRTSGSSFRQKRLPFISGDCDVQAVTAFTDFLGGAVMGNRFAHRRSVGRCQSGKKNETTVDGNHCCTEQKQCGHRVIQAFDFARQCGSRQIKHMFDFMTQKIDFRNASRTSFAFRKIGQNVNLRIAALRRLIKLGREKGSGLFLWSSSWASCGFEAKSHSAASCPVVIAKRQAAFDTAAKCVQLCLCLDLVYP